MTAKLLDRDPTPKMLAAGSKALGWTGTAGYDDARGFWRAMWDAAPPSPSDARAEAWQPISTAPKDGTEIDLWVECGARVADCRWGQPILANWGDRYGRDSDLPEGWTTRADYALDRRNGPPTHWMRVTPPAKDEAR